MEHYVTLFDSLFLPQGVALHMSMERHVKDYTLWILCVDDEAHEVLTKLKLPNVRVLQLSKLETEDLLRVKATRSKGEYCWTLTPFAPRFVFESDDNVMRVTYIDSDVWFLKDPYIAFQELEKSKKSLLITKHAYHPEYDYSVESGIYCVQFMIFKRYSSEVVRKWWEERCVEWCFARHENGKFGDQLYLNAWNEIFHDSVCVLSYGGYTLAPWNVQRFPFSDAFLYHFQGLRILRNGRVLLGPPLSMPQPVLRKVYKEYINDLKEVIIRLESIGFGVKAQRADITIFERIIAVGRELKRIILKIGVLRTVRVRS